MAWADIEPGTDPPVLAIGAGASEFDLCRQVPGAVIGKDDKIWRLPLTWAGYRALRCVWQRQPITYCDPLENWAAAKWDEISQRYAMREMLCASDPALSARLIAMDTDAMAASGWKDGDRPRMQTDVQMAATEWLFTWRRAILGDDRGNGKTPPTIRALQLLASYDQGYPAMIVCPDSAPLAWQDKMALWSPEIRTVVAMGSATERRKAFDAISEGKADALIICWQNLRYHTRLAMYPGQAYVQCSECAKRETGKTVAVCETHLKEANAITWRTLVLDEAQKMADPKGKQTRAAWWLAHHCENMFATTGTLTVNSVADLWSVYHAMDPRAHPVRSKYIDLYAQQEYAYERKGRKVLGVREDNAPWFHKVIDPYFRRIPKEIARAGQPLMTEPEFRYPQLSPAQARAYKGLAKAGLAELGDRELIPENTVVKFTRLCQLAAAMIEVEDGEDALGFTQPEVRMAMPSHKVDDLDDFLASNPGQWVVACNTPQLVELCGRRLTDLEVSWTKIIGGMGTQAKHDAQVAFQNGDHRVIFCTEAGGTSIDLDAAEGIFWLQPNPSWAARDQLNGRVDRYGRTTPARQVHAITPGTVDVRLYQLGLDKNEIHQSVVQDAKMLRWMLSVAPGEIIGEGHGTASNIPV